MKTGEDFFLSGRSLPGWITGLAFLSANLGALEVIGMVANSAKYGIATVHFYWVGAVLAMAFLGVFMMPFYYGSRVRTVPEYLKLRYNEATRGLNAISFAIMTILMSGISLYAMALLFNSCWAGRSHASILFAAVVVLLYVFWGGLSSSIYNEVIQFFLIWLGLLPIVFLGLKQVGGFAGLTAKLNREHAPRRQVPRHEQQSAWASTGSAWPWASASCWPSATGRRTSWSSSAPWPPRTSTRPG